MNQHIDAVTVEILGNLLLSIAEEMGVAIIKSAYSTNIKERRDISTAVFDPDGNLVAQAEHVAMHLGSLLGIIHEVYKKYDIAQISPGDMFMGNDPYNGGGTHLPDITIAAPVFVDDTLVGWVANCAHHSDVGGKVPGSVAGDANSIFQEGLKIPLVRVCSQGHVNMDIVEFIMSNSRMPNERYGDVQAQIAANRVGKRRMISTYRRYGAVMLESMKELQRYTQRRLRAGIQGLPDGDYSFEDFMDDAGVGSAEPVRICVNIHIRGDEMTLDFTGTHQQVPGPVNMTFNGLLATVFYSLKALIDPTIPSNAGIYRSFRVIAEPGLIVSAVDPAPVGERIDSAMRTADVIFGAMAKAVPQRAIAGCNSSCTSAIFSGHDSRLQGQFYVYLETIAGGSGATMHGDGLSGVQVHMTNTSNLPIEALEMEFPLVLVQKYALRPDSGGAGRYRGGLGIERVFEAQFANISFTGLGDRQVFPPWGIEGGQAGLGGAYYLTRRGKSPVRLPSKCNDIEMLAGDTVAVLTPGAGGYGQAFDRDPQAVLVDVIDGKVSVEAARRDYGVAVYPHEETYELSEDETQQLRASFQ